MPRYFFDTDNAEHDTDLVGVELRSAKEAQIQAVVFAGEYLRDNPGTVWDGRRFCVEVRDTVRALVLRVTVEAEGPEAG